MQKSLMKKCEYGIPQLRNQICNASFLLFTLTQNNLSVARKLELSSWEYVINNNLFKVQNLSNFNKEVIDKLQYDVGPALKNTTYNWNCANSNVSYCADSINMTYTFLHKLLPLTSRVTKLGTLVAWADAFDDVADFLLKVHQRLTGLETYTRFDQLVKISDPTLDKYAKDEAESIKYLDERGNSCWPNTKLKDPCTTKGFSNDSLHFPDCCCDLTSCNNVTLKSMLRVMKEAVHTVHIVDLDKRMEHFRGNLSDDSSMRKPPSYLTEDIVGYKLINENNFLDQENPHSHFLTPEPIIPICKINDEFTNLPYHGIEGVFKDGKYCSLFRPDPTDYGMCFTMNSFKEVSFFD